MKKPSSFFYRISSGWVALAGVMLFIVFCLFTLPSQSAQSAAYSQGLGSPDTSLFYEGSTVYRMAEAYGEAGRSAYVRARWSFDLAFPLVYTFFFLTSISWLFVKNIPAGSPWRMLNLVPLLGMGFDYLENAATTLVMTTYPGSSLIGQNLASISTPFKWLFIAASFLLLFAGVGVKLARRVRKGKVSS
ncbi:MAG: hypothetical protein NTZ74_02150 [Chloroflexi bacterium]|nr:hypothetical protein [Chloroflexota bacterium]